MDAAVVYERGWDMGRHVDDAPRAGKARAALCIRIGLEIVYKIAALVSLAWKLIELFS